MYWTTLPTPDRCSRSSARRWVLGPLVLAGSLRLGASAIGSSALRSGAVLLSSAVVLTSSVASAASTESAEEQVRRAAEISKTTMSPFCPGRTVDACPSPNATAWREDIRRWVGEGLSTEEIRHRLKARADQDLSGAPSTALDSVLPVLATVLSLVLLGLLLRLLVKTPANPNSAASSGRETLATKEGSKSSSTHEKVSEDELEARLKRELEQLDD